MKHKVKTISEILLTWKCGLMITTKKENSTSFLSGNLFDFSKIYLALRREKEGKEEKVKREFVYLEVMISDYVCPLEFSFLQ